MQQERVRLKAKGTFHSEIVGTQRRGDRFWATPQYAGYLYGLGLVEPVNAGPTEHKPAGPSEIKTEDAAAKKPSGAPTAGRSIGTASSSAPGAGGARLSSAAVQALRQATDLFARVQRAIATGGRFRF